MKTILITAYAMNPYKGSEDGTGWNFVKEISKEFNVIVITRKNNKTNIEEYISKNPDNLYQNIQFDYFDLPSWVMWLKKRIGERGYVLYFYLWQLFIPFFIKKQKWTFDMSHSLNFHSDSHPNFLWTLKKPVLWGPLGHHPMIPKEYITKVYGYNFLIKDRIYNIAKWMMRNLDPFFYLAKYNSSKIIGINSSVQKTMRISNKKFIQLSAVAYDNDHFSFTEKEKFKVLSCGRFVEMKGFDITIRSFAKFYHTLTIDQQKKTELILVGKGHLEDSLKEIIRLEKIEAATKIISWVNYDDMKKIYEESSIFLFPSHEGAGMVVPEALSYGLPTLCFDNIGPGELVGEAGIKIKYGNYEESIREFALNISNLFFDKILFNKLQNLSRLRFEEEFTWESKGIKIRNIIHEILNYEQNNNPQQNNPQQTVLVFHPSSELYGADRILCEALKAIPKDHKKIIFIPKNGPLINFLYENVENIEVNIKKNIPIIYRAIFTPLGVLKFTLQLLSFFLFAIHLKLKYRKKTLIYLNTLSCSFLSPILYFFRFKTIVHVHEIIESPKIISKLTAWLSFKFTSKVVCVSKEVLLNLKLNAKDRKKRGVVLYNGIKPIHNKPSKNEKINIHLFGRLKKEKGQLYLIETLSKLPNDILNKIKVTLVGGILEGKKDELFAINSLISHYNLNEIIEIKEFTNDISIEMSKADICVVPSLMKDPFPTTVLEGMSAGKIVIATNTGGAKEAIHHEVTGFLIPADNSEYFASVITKIIESPHLLNSIGKNAQISFNQRFHQSKFSNNWNELYSKIAA